MKRKRLAVRISAMAALMCTVVGLSGHSAFASRTPESTQTAVTLSDVLSNFAVTVEDPLAVYEGARVVQNVTVNDEKGMAVYAKFRVRNGLDIPCMMIAYFYYDDEVPTPLKAGDPHYRDKKGNVTSSVNFTPADDPAVYEGLQLFIPYEALNMGSGDTYALKFYLALYNKKGERFFGKSGWYKFTLKMP